MTKGHNSIGDSVCRTHGTNRVYRLHTSVRARCIACCLYPCLFDWAYKYSSYLVGSCEKHNLEAILRRGLGLETAGAHRDAGPDAVGIQQTVCFEKLENPAKNPSKFDQIEWCGALVIDCPSWRVRAMRRRAKEGMRRKRRARPD